MDISFFNAHSSFNWSILEEAPPVSFRVPGHPGRFFFLDRLGGCRFWMQLMRSFDLILGCCLSG